MLKVRPTCLLRQLTGIYLPTDQSETGVVAATAAAEVAGCSFDTTELVSRLCVCDVILVVLVSRSSLTDSALPVPGAELT